MLTFERFLEHHQADQLWFPGAKVLLAVSGGVDSMVMWDLFKRTDCVIGIAHMHFGLREKEADRDQLFVEEQAKVSLTPVYSTQRDTRAYAAAHGISIETAARALRYTWLESIRQQEGYDFIATGHHADDDAETMLMHLTRGTGVKGMGGIPVRNGHVIRPLLFATRQEIYTYARTHQIPFVEDSTNSDTQITRNHFRHAVIPQLEKINPAFTHTMQENAIHFREAAVLMQERVDQLLSKWVRQIGDTMHVLQKPLCAHPAAATLLYHWLGPYGFQAEQCKQILRAAGHSGKQFLSVDYRLITTRTEFILVHQEASAIQTQYIDTDVTSIHAGPFTLQFRTLPFASGMSLDTAADMAQFDLALLQWPLMIRPWQKGDYMYPYGVYKSGTNKPGKKKLSDLFTDAKYHLLDKERAVVLCSGEHILWVPGLRQDARFIVSKKTTKVLRVQVK